LAILVMALWGVNFVVIRVGLDNFPPILFSALRFTAVAVPAVLFVGRPRVPWRWILAVGFALGVVKFSLLFAGMAAGMPTGLASLVLQCQVVFTAAFAVVLLRERPGARQVLGTLIAAAGIVLVAARPGPERPLTAMLLVIGAGAAWGIANIAMRKANAEDMLRFMVWVSAVASLPLISLSLLIEGPERIGAALGSLDLAGIGAVAYVAVVATLFGFGVWGMLIRRYGASTIAPFSMLAPVFAVIASALLLGETMGALEIAAGVLVIGGVLLATVRVRPAAAPPLPLAPVPVAEAV